mgnify:CR=1 FL=1
MKYTLTVFTTTYNRAHTLNRCYESLKRQTSRDFLWLIIDDGSTDNTKELVKKWANEGIIPIRYHYKKNGGMHTGHNTAYRLIDTELNVCIDSDDYMPDNAVEIIVSFWKENKSDDCAGIFALDADYEGNVLGDKFPNDIKKIHLNELDRKYRLKGDKKFVFRTDIVSKYPKYPEFEGEKNFPLSYKTMLIDKDYKFLLLNRVLCNVEYQEDGSSKTIVKQYFTNPKGFYEFRKFAMVNDCSFKRRFIQCIHYVSSAIILKNKKFLKESPKKLMTIVAIPAGYLFNKYISIKQESIQSLNKKI